ncbi:hypothetical protein HMF8227_02973 [Saliniradius amylolyticus]|uniref:Entericidin A n=1 Tax=Saliniradius amylolyticus TaxID=2183582 RepID=A0A2S2E6Z1_9ALTE|nr:entericidin A/B family lipoprotein [Saliniradius amylolyticus]AWL13421.1 hypothetical protein HMF8227_02973 [Saliniradius amylolyticus]
MQKMKPLIALCSALALLLAGGCATMEGIGKDLEKAGEEIQEASES